MSSLGAPLIPTIAHTYGVTLSSAQWVLTAALLTGALATPVTGRLADGSRQRDVITVTLSLVLAGCVLSALATSFTVLVLGRAIATLSVSTAIGAGLGYPITATVAQLLGVHAAYWFGALMVGCALTAALVVLPARTPANRIRFDTPGAVLLSLAVTAVSVVLSEGGSWGWTSVVLAVWIPHELRSAHPLVNLHHLANRSVLMADVAGFLMSVSLYLVVPIVVEFIQIPTSTGFGFGATVIMSGVVLTPLSLGTFLASRLLVPYERRFGVRSMIPLGALVFAAASTYFALDHGSLWQAFATMGIAGLGIGFTFAAMPGFIIRAVPTAETGSATGFYQVLRNIGLSVGSALGAAVLLAYTPHGASLPDLDGFRVALLVSAGLGLLTAVLSFVLSGAAPHGGHRSGAGSAPDDVEVRMAEEALLDATGAMLVDELDLDAGDRG